MGHTSRTLLGLAFVVLLGHASRVDTAGMAQPASDSPVHPGWSNAAVPGGSVALLSAVGIESPIERYRLVPELVRLLYATPDEEREQHGRQLARFLETVQRQVRTGRGSTPSAGKPADVVPLPLAPRVWTELILKSRTPPDQLLGRILLEREASLLYVGLLPLDDETLSFLAADRATLSHIHRRSVATFAAFGRALRVREGRVMVPGGPALEPAWEGLVGERMRRAGPFVRLLFSRDEGRVAYFYDAVSQLSPEQLARLLSRESAADTASRLAAFYRVFAEFDASWRPSERPFSQRPFDPAWLLTTVDVTPDELRWTTPADPSVRLERVHGLLLGRRIFGDRPADPELRESMQVAGPLASLFMILERMGVRDRALYADASRHALRLTNLPNGDRVATSLALFQGSMALMDRVRLTRVLSADQAHSLVRSVITLPWTGGPGDAPAVARWLATELVPAAGGFSDAAPDSVETALLRVMAGVARDAAQESRSRPVEWEEAPYVIDLGRPELARLEKVRHVQTKMSVDLVLQLGEVLAGVQAGGELNDSEKAARACEHVASALRQSGPAVGPTMRDARETAGFLVELAGMIRSGERALDKAREATERRLAQVFEQLLADAFIGLAYLPYLGRAEELSGAAATASARHDFAAAAGRSGPGPWKVAQEIRGTGTAWRFSGSLLGLDVALGRLNLRRIDSDLPPPPTLNENHRAVFVETAALSNARDLDEESRDALVGAIAEGRRRVHALTRSDSAGARVLAERAGLSASRTRLLSWVLAEEPEALEGYFSLSEVYWVGAADRAPVWLDRWGSSALATDACLCLRFPRAIPWERAAGRPETGLLAATTVDLSLRIAEILADRKLPAALSPGVLSLATLDFVDGIRAVHDDDRAALVRQAQGLAVARVEDYVGALTAGGPLVPAPQATRP
jgi:hypothetical protein